MWQNSPDDQRLTAEAEQQASELCAHISCLRAMYLVGAIVNIVIQKAPRERPADIGHPEAMEFVAGVAARCIVNGTYESVAAMVTDTGTSSKNDAKKEAP